MAQVTVFVTVIPVAQYPIATLSGVRVYYGSYGSLLAWEAITQAWEADLYGYRLPLLILLLSTSGASPIYFSQRDWFHFP